MTREEIAQMSYEDRRAVFCFVWEEIHIDAAFADNTWLEEAMKKVENTFTWLKPLPK